MLLTFNMNLDCYAFREITFIALGGHRALSYFYNHEKAVSTFAIIRCLFLLSSSSSRQAAPLKDITVFNPIPFLLFKFLVDKMLKTKTMTK